MKLYFARVLRRLADRLDGRSVMADRERRRAKAKMIYNGSVTPLDVDVSVKTV